MQTAASLLEMGIKPTIIEKSDRIGGKLNDWHKLFPSFTPAHEVLESLKQKMKENTYFHLDKEISLLQDKEHIRY